MIGSYNLVTGRRGGAVEAALALAVALILAGPAIGADEELPDGAAVLDRYVEATGGGPAYQRLQTSTSKGTFELPAQGVTFEMVRYGARPNKAAVTLTSEAFGTIERGTDGVSGWETSVMSGARLMEGEELTDMVRDAIFDSVAGWRDVWETAETTGVESVNDRPCYRVELTPRTGTPQTVYFDVESGLLAKVERVVKSVMGEVPVESFSSDWREVGGVLVAHRAEVVAAGQKRVVTLASVEYNVDLPAGCFDPPEDVRKLFAKADSQP